VQALQKVYGLGTRVPLNGKNASIAGIIGGSHQTKNGYQIRAGIIPRSHRGAIIFEELGKASNELLRELTDIRSSGIATITRVSGSTSLPATVRMLTLTNPKVTGTQPRPISSYANGIQVVTDLVGNAEDIARYDIMAILPERGSSSIDPFFNPPEPFSEEAYRARIRWIWSREPEQVNIEEDVYRYAVNVANQANKKYNSYIKIFGTEAWLKLLRIAVCVAGYTVSTDKHFENIIVTKEHIDYAIDLVTKLYDNPTFRLKEFVDSERKYRECKKEDIEELQKIWDMSPNIVEALLDNSIINKSGLQMSSGESMENLSRTVNNLVKNQFVRIEQYNIIASEKFRKAMLGVKRKSKIPQIDRIG
jgi:hypothetical protein